MQIKKRVQTVDRMLPFFLLTSLTFFMVECLVTLPKPKTVSLVLAANFEGNVSPLGEICKAPVEMFLNEFNNQYNHLPGYNLVVEMVDDGCSPNTALNSMIPLYLQWNSMTNISHGNQFLPRNLSFNFPSAEIAVKIPLIGGPICSGACKVVSKFPQHFNLLSTTTGCIDPTMDNSKVYGNHYRLSRSSAEYTQLRIALAKEMNWSKIAVISDTSQYTYAVGL